MFPGINFWNLLILLRDRPGLGLIFVSSNFQVLLLLRDELQESLWERWIPVKKSLKLLDTPFPELIQ